MNAPHKHAALIKAWADGAQIEQCYRGCGGEACWEDFRGVWDVDGIYRVKPKPLIKKWKWVVKDGYGDLYVTRATYRDADDFGRRTGRGGVVIQKVDSTMSEVEDDS